MAHPSFGLRIQECFVSSQGTRSCLAAVVIGTLCYCAISGCTAQVSLLLTPQKMHNITAAHPAQHAQLTAPTCRAIAAHPAQDALRDEFAKFGNLIEAFLFKRGTETAKGAFVRYSDRNCAQRAINTMNNSQV